MHVELFNRQRGIQVDFPRLRVLAELACLECLTDPGGGRPVLSQLVTIEISVVSDRTIAQVHRRFLGVPGATDVITFEHGEIVVSATTAARQSVLLNERPDRELARYIIHGLLHLNGHLDKDPTEAATMWKVQEKVLESLWPKEG